MTKQTIKEKILSALNFNPTIIQEKKEGKTDSLFYEGDIAEVIKSNGTRLTLIATGDIKIEIEKEYYNNGNIQDFIEKYNLDDKKLEDLNSKNKIEWINNNWFEVIFIKEGNDYVDSEIGVTPYDYDEGMELLKSYFDDEEY